MTCEWARNWRETRLKYESSLKGRLGWQGLKADEYRDEGPYVVSSAHFEDEKVNWSRCPRVSEERYLRDVNIQLRDCDLLVMKDGSVGQLAYIDKLPGKACLNSHLLLLRPLSHEYVPRFMFYLATTSLFQNYLWSRATGTTFLGVSQRAIGNFPILLPPVADQTQIAKFLDYETGRIDALMEKQQQLIGLLKEKRQAVISHAVTQGLNPDAPMRDSGVEWLGEVPAHWEIMSLRRLVSAERRLTYGIVQPGEPDDTGRYMVRGKDYSFGWAAADSLFRVSDAIEKPYKRSRLRAGDLVMTIVGAGVGNVAVIPDWLDGANITQTTSRIAVDQTKADSRFVRSVLEGAVGRRSVGFYAKGAAQPGLNLEHVKLFPVTVPPLAEQREIANYLERRELQMLNLTLRAERTVGLLQERRTALISAAVTGKIDVRNWKAPEPQTEVEVA